MDYEIFCNNYLPGWVKRADKRSHNCQASVVKATAGVIKLCENLLNTEKQNYVVHTKDLLSLTMESMLLGHVNFSMNNMRRDMIKNSLQKDLHSVVKQVILPPFCSQGMTPPKKNLLSIGIIKTYLTSPISGQETQSTILPTIPKQQTIQELTNTVSIKLLDILSIWAYFR